jgi:HSP20 family protein
MNITRYEPVYRRGRPLSLLGQLLQEPALGSLLGTDSGARNEPDVLTDWLPAVDIREDDERFMLLADLPGVKPEDIAVSMEAGILTIEGSRDSETKEDKSDYKRYERIYGKFLRRFTLPDTADGDKISAQTNNGVLEVIIPKQPRPQARRIAVKPA